MKEFPKELYRGETGFDNRVHEMEASGWIIVGHEGLARTKFSKDARFLPEVFQTADDIRKIYIDKAKQEDPSHEYEIELVLDENTDKLQSIRKVVDENQYKEILAKLKDEDKAFIVFMRRKGESGSQ